MKKSVAIIGGGTAGLMLACELSTDLFDIHIYEKNKALGRKFLVAGEGGLNITHSESFEFFELRYSSEAFIKPFLNHFSNVDLQYWLKEIGVETYVGSSKRVFPIRGIKPIEVLNAIIKKTKSNHVEIHTSHIWKGWTANNNLIFETNNQEIIVKADYVIFALGGASWSVTGSDGNWLNTFSKKRIETKKFEASNCAVECNWNKDFVNKCEGRQLKNIAIKTSSNIVKKGELVITSKGLEGGAIYALASYFREELKNNKQAEIFIDLKPAFSIEKVKLILFERKNKSIIYQLKNELKLNQSAIELLATLPKDDYNETELLATHIKNFSVSIIRLAQIEEAISTVGGISLSAINENCELKIIPNQFVIGEMLDWDAPTGGYLLQACFSMGKYLADYLNQKK